MEKTEHINELAAALIKFQGEIPVITFDSKVKVTTKTGGAYSFAYASLKAIKETCKPILLKNELAVSQLVGAKRLTTMLIHSSGQFISDAMELPIRDSMNPQEIGSIITYMKRYSFSAILGLVSDEDDDANIAEGNKVDIVKKGAKKDIEYLEEGAVLAKLEGCKTIKELTDLWAKVDPKQHESTKLLFSYKRKEINENTTTS